jgi:hypothetical protein
MIAVAVGMSMGMIVFMGMVVSAIAVVVVVVRVIVSFVQFFHGIVSCFKWGVAGDPATPPKNRREEAPAQGGPKRPRHLASAAR